MRHGKKFNHLSRKAGHRKALMRNMSNSLITHKRINTTLAKAKALRKYLEPLITKSKTNSTHSRRVVFSYLNNKDAVKELFDVISAKIADRPGGYLRIIKTSWRKGDGAEMAMIEFVDYNEVYVNEGSGDKKETGKKKRTRRGGAKKAAAVAAAASTTTEADAEVEEAASDEKSDDLKIVEGIGPKIEEILKAGGIENWAALSAANVDTLKELLAAAGDRYKAHDPTTWPEQAKLANDGNWDKLKTWQDELDGGRVVDTSEEE